MTKDVNDVHRELGIDGLRERGDSLPDLDFKEPVPKAQGNGLDVAARDDDFSVADKIDLEISRLAKLREVDYEKARKDAASKLGMRASILDKLVAAERPDSTPGNGRPLELATPVPWPEPVNGAVLVAQMTAAIRKYVVLTENDGLIVALWVLHSYCFDAVPCRPRLAITAPEKRCGKSTLLDVIALLVLKALATANISAAAGGRMPGLGAYGNPDRSGRFQPTFPR